MTDETTAQTISADFPFEPHYLEVRGSKMHYIDEGTGDPILFLHGVGTWSYLWRNIIPHLTPLGRCMALDLIGFGRSDKPDIEYRFFDHILYVDAFIEQMGLKNLTLVCHDWGARLALHYARHHEAHIKGLAFLEFEVGPHTDWDGLSEDLRAFFEPLRGPEAWDLVVNQNMLIEQLLPAAIVRQLSGEEMDQYRQPFKEPSTRKPLWRLPQEVVIGGKPEDVCEEILAEDQWFQHTNVPKLLFHATPGMIIPESKVEYCQQHLKNLTTVHLGKGVHLLQEDNPHLMGVELAKWYSTL